MLPRYGSSVVCCVIIIVFPAAAERGDAGSLPEGGGGGGEGSGTDLVSPPVEESFTDMGNQDTQVRTSCSH